MGKQTGDQRFVFTVVQIIASLLKFIIFVACPGRGFGSIFLLSFYMKRWKRTTLRKMRWDMMIMIEHNTLWASICFFCHYMPVKKFALSDALIMSFGFLLTGLFQGTNTWKIETKWKRCNPGVFFLVAENAPKNFFIKVYPGGGHHTHMKFEDCEP